MTTLKILSGGAAQGLADALVPTFKRVTGWTVEGEFGAVGTMADKLRAGAPADVVVLTTAVLKALAEQNLIDLSTIKNVGLVETAVAVRAGDPAVGVGSADELRAALLASDAIFVPDTKSSTAGIHVATMLERLGISADVANRIREFPNGATAMRHLAASDAKRPIGCTQTTEILNTPGLTLIGALPRGYDLATMYAAALTATTKHAGMGRAFIDLLTAGEHRALRQRAGFIDKT